MINNQTFKKMDKNINKLTKKEGKKTVLIEILTNEVCFLRLPGWRGHALSKT